MRTEVRFAERIMIFSEIDQLNNQINQHIISADPRELMQIKEYYRIGLTYTSNALEGNSLTESETKVVLEEGITIGGKRLHDHLEAVGHSQAYDYMYALTQKKQLEEKDIKYLHHLFYFRIDEAQAGVYRTERAYITGSHYALPLPEKIPGLMQDLVERLATMRETLHPVEYAALAHKEFVFIHPFIDGNGRVARLLMNLVLLSHGFTIAIIPPILRQEYIRALEKAHTNDRDFVQFIAQVVKETQKDYIRLFVA